MSASIFAAVISTSCPNGDRVAYDSDRACAWCAIGALAAAADDRLGTGSAVSTADVIADELGVGSLPAWNDEPGRTQAEVVAALRGAPLGEVDE